MYLRALATASLADVDGRLRSIWVECCEHSSKMKIADNLYFSSEALLAVDHGARLMGTVTLGTILAIGTSIKYSYDFGTPTELKIKVLHKGQIKKEEAGKPKVELMMRNRRPILSCDKKGCFGVAKVMSQEDHKLLCVKHAQKIYGNVDSCHENCHSVSNSPRFGTCGYESEHRWNDSDDDYVDIDWDEQGEGEGEDTPYDTSSGDDDYY